MSQGFLITGEVRRRDWSDERKLELLSDTFGPGGSVSEVAPRESISTGLVYRWRKKFSGKQDGITFAPAILADPRAAGSRTPCEPAVIVVEVQSGARVRIRGSASAARVFEGEFLVVRRRN